MKQKTDEEKVQRDKDDDKDIETKTSRDETKDGRRQEHRHKDDDKDLETKTMIKT